MITMFDKSHMVMVDVIRVLFLTIIGTTFSITVLFLIVISSLGNVNVRALVIWGFVSACTWNLIVLAQHGA